MNVTIERKEDAFVYTKDSSVIDGFNDETVDILHRIDEFICFSPFIPGAIHNGLEVILKDRETLEISKTLAELNEEIQRLEKELENLKANADQAVIGEIQERIRRLKEVVASCIKTGKSTYVFEVELLGKYVRVNDGTPKGKPAIYLMWETLKRHSDFVNLTAITYIHELMHAYFDMHYDKHGNHVPHPYCPELEEPLAEFGMLSFMEKFDRAFPSYKILETAIANVSRKKKHLGTCHYGFGHFLFEDKNNFCVNWVDLFRLSCLSIDESGKDLKSYKSMISPIRYPFHEYLCETALYKVIAPKRFHFTKYVQGSSRGMTKLAGPSGAIDRLDIHVDIKEKQFLADYLYRAPLDVVITFVGKSGVRIRGEAKIYKASKGSKGARFYIEKDKFLLTQYALTFKKKVRFLFYEDKLADSLNPAEWIAKEI